MNRNIVILLLLLSGAKADVAFGQKDSLLHEIKRQQTASEEMFGLINEANELYAKSPDIALDKIEKALRMAYANKDMEGQAYCLQTLAAIQYRIGNYRQALIYNEKAMELFEERNLTKPYLISLRSAGESAEASGAADKAIAYYRAWLRQDKSLNQTMVRESLARVYFNTNKPMAAKDEFLILEKAYIRTGNAGKLVSVYENLGKSYSKLQDTTRAIRYFQRSDSMRVIYQPNYDSAVYYENLSYSYTSSDPKRGVEYEKKALEVNKRTNRSSKVVQNNLSIGQQYMAGREPGKAIPFIVESINLAEQLGELESSGEAYKALVEAYERVGDYRKARESFERYKTIQENILENKESEATEFIRENMDLFEKDKRIALLVREKELDEDRINLLVQQKRDQEEILARQQQINFFLVIVAALLFLGIFLLIRGNRQRKIANKLLAIRSLRSQMNPHFIFNSLNSVNSFISQSDEKSANKYLSEFSRLMRMVLHNSKEDFVPLDSELEILDRYLKLEHLRFGDHFDYVFEVDPAIEAGNISVPPMLFQPFIENAIWHGLRYLERDGHLKVVFIGDNGLISVVIEDNGIGRARSEEMKTANQSMKKSQGIRNTNDRVRLLNEVHHAGINVIIGNLNDDADYPGTRVEITIPVRYIEDHSPAI